MRHVELGLNGWDESVGMEDLSRLKASGTLIVTHTRRQPMVAFPKPVDRHPRENHTMLQRQAVQWANSECRDLATEFRVGRGLKTWSNLYSPVLYSLHWLTKLIYPDLH